MGMVIEICVKYPGGPTRKTGTDIHAWHGAVSHVCVHAISYISSPYFKVGPRGVLHIFLSITTSVVSAWKNYHAQIFLGGQTDF
jgi:hypothetical protein